MKNDNTASARLLIKKSNTSCFIDETEKVIASNCRTSKGIIKKNEKKQRFKKSLSNSSFLKNYFEFESNDHDDRLTTFKVKESLDSCYQYVNIVKEDMLIVSQNSNDNSIQITNEANQDVNQPCYINNYQNNIMMIEYLLMLFNDYFNSTALNQEFFQ